MASPATLNSWVEWAAKRLDSGPHPERARPDAELLLLHILDRDRAYLIAHGSEALSADDAARYGAFVSRRMDGEPMQYIAGEAEFYGLLFHVTRDVLIPRPETEHAVEKVLELAAQFHEPRIADVGTGSGAIAVALARRRAGARIVASDLSPAALEMARRNAARNSVAERIYFLNGDLLIPMPEWKFDVVVSNPPYVAETDRASLPVEVREFEPASALFAGADGLAVYRRLIPQAYAALVSGGWIVLEIGCGQDKPVRMLLEEAGFAEIDFTADLRRIPRVASARRP